MKRLVIAAVIIAGFLLPGAYAAKSKKAADGHRIAVKPGQSFSIRLNSNPTTGYGWQIQNPIDKSLLVIVNKTFTPKSKKLVGSPGKETWQFKALGKGTVFITFAYKRSWESDIAKKESYTVVIK